MKNLILLFCFLATFNLSAQKEYVGVSTGFSWINGNNDSGITDGYSLGLHYKRQLFSHINLEGNFYHASIERVNTNLDVLNHIFNFSEAVTLWYPNYKTSVQTLNIGIGTDLNLGKFNLWLNYGVGLMTARVQHDLLDGNGAFYANLQNLGPSALDGIYETEAIKQAGAFRLGEETNLYITHYVSLEMTVEIAERLSVGTRCDVSFSDSDYLDGIKEFSPTSFFNERDLINRLNLIGYYRFSD
jgi:hypothetical protein